MDIEIGSVKNFDKDNFLEDLQIVYPSLFPIFLMIIFYSLWATVYQLTNIFDEHVALKRKSIRNDKPAFFSSKPKKAVMTKRHFAKKIDKNFLPTKNLERY